MLVEEFAYFMETYLNEGRPEALGDRRGFRVERAAGPDRPNDLKTGLTGRTDFRKVGTALARLNMTKKRIAGERQAVADLDASTTKTRETRADGARKAYLTAKKDTPSLLADADATAGALKEPLPSAEPKVRAEDERKTKILLASEKAHRMITDYRSGDSYALRDRSKYHILPWAPPTKP